MEFKEYRKTATVKAKLFEKGDEDGMTWTKDEISNGRENHHFGMPTPEKTIPYIVSLENQEFHGKFEENYLCIGIKGEKWLVEKEIFEKTYEPLDKNSCEHPYHFIKGEDVDMPECLKCGERLY